MPSFVDSRDNDCISFIDQDSNLLPIDKKNSNRYTYIDESMMNSLHNVNGWSRDNGIVELIPIAVVCKVDNV